MGPRAGLDRCGKSRPHRDSIPGPSVPQPVAVPTELPGTHFVSGFVTQNCAVKFELLMACHRPSAPLSLKNNEKTGFRPFRPPPQCFV